MRRFAVVAASIAKVLVVAAAGMGLGAVAAWGQAAPASADPYANNPAAGTMQFPLAAPAGKDSGAIDKAPAGAVNQGLLDPAKWKYGPNYDVPGDVPIWNPVMIKMMKGEKVTGGTTRATGTRWRRCGRRVRMPRRCPGCGWRIRTSARFSMRWMRGRW